MEATAPRRSPTTRPIPRRLGNSGRKNPRSGPGHIPEKIDESQKRHHYDTKHDDGEHNAFKWHYFSPAMTRSTFGILSPKPGLAHQSSAHHRPGFFFQQSHRIVANSSRDAKRLVDPKALEFEINAEQNLLDLTEELSGKSCRPSPSFCFIAKNDKHREVFAADFRDRKAVRCWKLDFRPKNLFTQYQFFRRRFRGLIVFQVGCFLELYNRDAVWANKKRYMRSIHPRKGFYARCGAHVKAAENFFRTISGVSTLCVMQTGKLHGGVEERIGFRIDRPLR